MCFSSPSVPAATPPPASAQPVQEQDQAVQAALDRERMRQAARLGKRSTMLTGAAGLSAPSTPAPKTMLGA
jgi:hypothetical protein